MATNECVVFGHIDVLPPIPHAMTMSELLLKGYVLGGQSEPGLIDALALKQLRFVSHCEFIRRFESEEAYFEHLSNPYYRGIRAGVGWALGAPYEDRILRLRTPQPWPVATTGDFVAITQFQVLPKFLDQSQPLLDGLFDIQSAAAGLRSNIFFQRTIREWNYEILSVWSSQEAFEEYLSSDANLAAREPLSELTIAPLEDRQHNVLCGTWSEA